MHEMVAFGFLLLIIGIFVLINTFNGNLPGLVDIPGIHDATTALRGMDATARNSVPSVSNVPGTLGSVSDSVGGIIGDIINAKGAIGGGAMDRVDAIAANATSHSPIHPQ